MLKELEIGFIRSFGAAQKIEFSIPDGTTPGSGYNIIVGKNNSGKTSIINLIRGILHSSTLTIGAEARDDIERPLFRTVWNMARWGAQTLEIDREGTGGLLPIIGDASKIMSEFRFVPSRRPFAAHFNHTHTRNPAQYDVNDFANRRMNPAYFDAFLASELFHSMLDPSERDRLLALLKSVDGRITGLDADNIGGQDVIRFKSASGRWHVISDTGDGITNLVRILYILSSAKDPLTIVIDEPELSLHPQLQKRLFKILFEHSAKHQLIVVSHSPYFIEWSDFLKAGMLARVSLNDKGESQIRIAGQNTIESVSRSVSNIMSRKYFDTVCKELFFSDEVVLVEGPEDAHYLANYASFLPIAGYGCGGAEAMPAWIQLCYELGIKTVAVLDGDKRELFESIQSHFGGTESVMAIILPREDIRDKYERNTFGKESRVVHKRGIFSRAGNIHEDVREEFDHILRQIGQFLGLDVVVGK